MANQYNSLSHTKWLAKVAKAIRLEQSESPRLETRAGNRAYSPCANHPFDGWL